MIPETNKARMADALITIPLRTNVAASKAAVSRTWVSSPSE